MSRNGSDQFSFDFDFGKLERDTSELLNKRFQEAEFIFSNEMAKAGRELAKAQAKLAKEHIKPLETISKEELDKIVKANSIIHGMRQDVRSRKRPFSSTISVEEASRRAVDDDIYATKLYQARIKQFDNDYHKRMEDRKRNEQRRKNEWEFAEKKLHTERHLFMLQQRKIMVEVAIATMCIILSVIMYITGHPWLGLVNALLSAKFLKSAFREKPGKKPANMREQLMDIVKSNGNMPTFKTDFDVEFNKQDEFEWLNDIGYRKSSVV